MTLPYDPALHAHLVEHGVEVRALNTGRQMELVHGLARAATPFALAAFLISVLTLWPTFTAKLDQCVPSCGQRQGCCESGICGLGLGDAPVCEPYVPLLAA